MSNLEQRIINLEEDIRKLKTHQLSGYDNSRVYKYPDIVEFTEVASDSNYILYSIDYETQTPFPLVSITAKVYENGTYVPNPRHTTLIPPGETRSSLGQYAMYDVVWLNGPPPSNKNQVLFYVNHEYGSANFTTRVVFSVVSTSPLEKITLTKSG